MSEEEKCIIACYRVDEDTPEPNPRRIRGHYCSKCGAEVWIMPENSGLGLAIWCRRCAAFYVTELGAFVQPASEARRRFGKKK